MFSERVGGMRKCVCVFVCGGGWGVNQRDGKDGVTNCNLDEHIYLCLGFLYNVRQSPGDYAKVYRSQCRKRPIASRVY